MSYTGVGGYYRTQITQTEDLRRILAIPRRVWSEADAEKLAVDMTNALRTPRGTMKLRPNQAIALLEIAQQGGYFGINPVGSGKTLISIMAGYVLESRNPRLFLPAGLIAKTNRDDLPLLMKHWRVPHNLKIVSYESLGRVSAAQFFEAEKPDLIIADECHRLKSLKTGVTRRFARYMADHPETKFVCMSGSMLKHSLKDFAHLMHWSLKENSCLPYERGELDEWCEVLDEKVPWRRVDPGEMLKMCSVEERKEPVFKAARLGFNRRLSETRGVVGANTRGLDTSLTIDGLTFPVNAATDANFSKLRNTWTTPDDWVLKMAVEVWRVARQLALGFHYRWDPFAPTPWREARAAWDKFVRETLSYSHSLDTEHQVRLAVENGDIFDGGLLERWKDIEPTFKPNVVQVWHDDSALNYCADWLKKNDGICWVEHSFFGKELSKRTGYPYFGRDGVDKDGTPIDRPGAPHEGKPIIASMRANGTGRNLQAWSANLDTSIAGGADENEQRWGRTHREGQKADEVVVDVLFLCAEHLDSWDQAMQGAEMARDMMGLTQKILIADKVLDTSRLRMLSGSRWTKTPDKGFELPKM